MKQRNRFTKEQILQQQAIAISDVLVGQGTTAKPDPGSAIQVIQDQVKIDPAIASQIQQLVSGNEGLQQFSISSALANFVQSALKKIIDAFTQLSGIWTR